ncbi:unnamed protein product [Spirodela intermedia]|uniref:Uncharacterized protein n=1 Tax=Spirodela intermedia TaxID=51605 RepID=A0A7I8ILN6_SPIIN|nr:unnamed protein product [Spirodela intermedia]CAA6658874.1 unnamed protein product [Spirodela intermedia]
MCRMVLIPSTSTTNRTLRNILFFFLSVYWYFVFVS